MISVLGTPCHMSDMFMMIYQRGYDHAQKGQEAQPLGSLMWLTNYTTECSEAFCKQAIDYYQAGYNGVAFVA